MSKIQNNKTYHITSRYSPAAKRRLNLYSAGNTADAMNVVLYTPDSTKEQKWLFLDSRLYIQTNLQYCLDRYNLPTSSSHNNADIYKASAKEDINQMVEIVPSGGCYKIKLLGQEIYLTAQSDVNGSSAGKTVTASGNVYWSAPVSGNQQLWDFEEVQAASDSQTKPPLSGQATVFPAASFYNAANNPLCSAYVGECTWYCLGRAHEAKGVRGLPISNAKKWYDQAKSAGFKVTTSSDDPIADSIAVWTKGTYGHVAFVESVRNGIVYFSEANWYASGDPRLSNKAVKTPPTGTDGQIKSASIASFKARYAPFAGCILL